jgi:hypothetical protein
VFIKVYRIPLSDVHTLELFTDGYPLVPTGSTIQAWEQANAVVEAEDPYRYKKYLATKPKDDRTVVIMNFGS